jgi:hypothetical protein
MTSLLILEPRVTPYRHSTMVKKAMAWNAISVTLI